MTKIVLETWIAIGKSYCLWLILVKLYLSEIKRKMKKKQQPLGQELYV